jgi:subtilase family serine protease
MDQTTNSKAKSHILIADILSFDSSNSSITNGPAGINPTSLQSAYNLTPLYTSGNTPGKGQIIGIVDWLPTNYPIIKSTNNAIAYDYIQYCKQFNLTPNLIIYQMTTKTSLIINSTTQVTVPSTQLAGYGTEIALDIQIAQAMAPYAKILLVLSPAPNYTDINNAINYAALNSDIVSMSFGGPEFTTFESTFTANSRKLFIASAGDSGPPAQYPSSSPNVLSIGGTLLKIGTQTTETPWNEATRNAGSGGGGPSSIISQPIWQKSVLTNRPDLSTTRRLTPDISFNGDPYSGISVYYGNWIVIGGTSLGAPAYAGIFAIINSIRNSGSSINKTKNLSTLNAVTALYKQYNTNSTGTFYDTTNGYFRNITSGSTVETGSYVYTIGGTGSNITLLDTSNDNYMSVTKGTNNIIATLADGNSYTISGSPGKYTFINTPNIPKSLGSTKISINGNNLTLIITFNATNGYDYTTGLGSLLYPGVKYLINYTV